MAMLLALAIATSGLHGVVMRGPTMPVCKVGQPCTEPAVGAVLVFTRNGHVAAKVTTKSGGRYSVLLPAGLYTVRLQQQTRIGTGLQPREARVKAGVNLRQNFAIDTGIR